LPSTITLDPNSSPRALAAAPNGAAIYVAYGVPSGDLVANSIAIVGTATNTLSGRIPLNANGFTGDGPLAMITDNSGTKLFVANTGSNNISVIDLASNSVVAALGAGVCTTPMGFARTPDTPYIYVVCRDSNNVLILDRDLNVLTLTVPLPAGTLPTSAVYDATNKRLIVTDSGDASLSVLAEDLTRPVAEHHSITTVPLGATPVGAAVLPDGSRIYVANTNGTVTVVNSSTLTVKTVIPIGGPGVQVGPSSDSLRVAVTTSTPELKVVDTGTESVVTTFPLTGPPKALLIF
jgi:YVTN family beta-propeller protein